MGWFAKKDEGKRKAVNEPLTATNRNGTVGSTVGSYNLPPVESVASANKYVAPNPVPSACPAVSQSPTSRHQLVDLDDEDMVVVENHQNQGMEDDYGDVENVTSATFSREGESDPEPPSLYDNGYGNGLKQTHLNSLFNGHLMKWKFEAEEGTGFLRVPAFFGALGLMVTAIIAVVLYPEAWEPHSIVMTVCVVIMSLFIIIMEGRFLAPNPLNARAHVRNIMTRNFNILRFVWGRGILYIMAGTINVAQTWIITMASGGFMIVLGFLAIFIGVHASRKFAALRNSLADESFLLLLFSYYDTDGDGYLEAYQFTNLLSYLGMELDDRYALKAFNAIDKNGDRRISYEEFHQWWKSGYIERGRKCPPGFEEEGRMA